MCFEGVDCYCAAPFRILFANLNDTGGNLLPIEIACLRQLNAGMPVVKCDQKTKNEKKEKKKSCPKNLEIKYINI